MPSTRPTKTGCSAFIPTTAKPPKRNSATPSPATSANTPCSTGSFVQATASCAGFPSNPPSSATRTARPCGWSARIAISPSRWKPSGRCGKAKRNSARWPKRCRIMCGRRAPDGFLNWFNPRVYEYAGSSPGELDGEKWGKIVHPDDIPGAVAAWTRAIGSGEAYEIEFRLRRADGAYRWFLARAVPARDEQGNIIRWIGTNTDVHDQKLIAGELARVERDAGRTGRGKNPRARPDLERVAGSAAGRGPQRHLANGQSGLDQDARLERGRTAEPDLAMAGASRRRRGNAGACQEIEAPTIPPSGSKAAFATRTDRIAGCHGPACRTRIASTRSPATSPLKRRRRTG